MSALYEHCLETIILVSELAKDASQDEEDIYEFRNMDELILFRKLFPEKMKYRYDYILSADTKDSRYIVLVGAAHFKQFKKQVEQRQKN